MGTGLGLGDEIVRRLGRDGFSALTGTGLDRGMDDSRGLGGAGRD